jgi:hypothetical protein
MNIKRRRLPLLVTTLISCTILHGAVTSPEKEKGTRAAWEKNPEWRGIGITTPDAKKGGFTPAYPLHISGRAGPQIAIEAGIYNYAGMALRGHATPSPWYVWATDTGETEFRVVYGGNKKAQAYLVINKNGTVAIGDAPRTAPSHSWVGDALKAKLYVKGDVRADGNFTASGHIMAKQYFTAPVKKAPDFVFEKNYQLPELAEVKKFIATNKHLPEIPSGKVMETHGVEMLDMQMKLLQKVEELMLYTIQQEEKIKALEAKVSELNKSE